MNYFAYQEHLTYLLKLIKKGKVNSPEQMAKEFSCNEKTVRGMINLLRKQGYEIVYSRKEKKYLLKK